MLDSPNSWYTIEVGVSTTTWPQKVQYIREQHDREIEHHIVLRTDRPITKQHELSDTNFGFTLMMPDGTPAPRRDSPRADLPPRRDSCEAKDPQSPNLVAGEEKIRETFAASTAMPSYMKSDKSHRRDVIAEFLPSKDNVPGKLAPLQRYGDIRASSASASDGLPKSSSHGFFNNIGDCLEQNSHRYPLRAGQ